MEVDILDVNSKTFEVSKKEGTFDVTFSLEIDKNEEIKEKNDELELEVVYFKGIQL